MSANTPNSNKKRIPWLPVAAAVVGAAFLVYGPSRTLIVQQLGMVFSRPEYLVSLLRDLGIKDEIVEGRPTADDRRAVSRIVSAHPDDVELAMAAANRAGSTDKAITELQRVAGKFPNTPALMALILRRMCMGQIKTDRPEEYLLTGGPVPAGIGQTQRNTVAYGYFDRMALAGEKADPKNGYFPAMRAIGLFGLGRDKEALAEWKRAGDLPEWKEYIDLEARGASRLQSELSGGGAFTRAATTSAILFPHYARLRGAARVAVYDAVAAEQAGRREEGLEVRHSIMKVGGMMRADGTWAITSLVGIAISAMAVSRPGGAPVVKATTAMPVDQQFSDKVEKYCAYLRSMGQGAEADWVRGQIESGLQAKKLLQEGLQDSSLSGKPMKDLMAAWSADLLMLTDIVWLLALATVALLFVRLKVESSLGASIAAMVILALLVYFTWMSRSTELMAAYSQVIANLTGGGDQSPFSNHPLSPAAVRIATVGAALLLPLFVTITGVIVRYSSRVTMAKGLLRAGVPVVSILVICYCAHLTRTLAYDRQANEGMDRMLRHEGRYYAEQLHRSWPGR